MAKSKKTESQDIDKLEFEAMPGADPIPDEDKEGFKVDMNFEEEPDTSKEGEESEEVEEEQEPTTDTEETQESEPEEGETEESEVPESSEEAGTEETVLESDAGDTQEPETTASEENKEPMIPKSRFDEVLAKQKALQKQLAEATAVQEEQEAVPDYNFDEKETEYQELVLNGETEKAAELRNEMRAAEKAQLMQEVRQEMGSTVQQNQDLVDLQVKAEELMEKYPSLNENSADYNQELQNEVLELRDAFVTKGYVPVDALTKATNYVMGINAPDPAPAPTENKKVKEAKQKAQVSKKIEASKSQPPTLQGEGVNSKKDTKLDISTLSTDEFNALPEETLKRMRGDFG
tara:strand:+ start:960 stop:2003 length:1044 start_codon:yes stop_codon:yes gene_type:complete